MVYGLNWRAQSEYSLDCFQMLPTRYCRCERAVDQTQSICGGNSEFIDTDSPGLISFDRKAEHIRSWLLKKSTTDLVRDNIFVNRSLARRVRNEDEDEQSMVWWSDLGGPITTVLGVLDLQIQSIEDPPEI